LSISNLSRDEEFASRVQIFGTDPLEAINPADSPNHDIVLDMHLCTSAKASRT